MAMSAEHRSKFAALRRQWWRLHISEKYSSGTKKSKQTPSRLQYYEILTLPCFNWIQPQVALWELVETSGN